MRVVKSTLERDDHAQRDGSVWVVERHDLGDGLIREYRYLCAPKDDPEAIMAERAAAIGEELANPRPVDALEALIDKARAAYAEGDAAAVKARLAEASTIANSRTLTVEEASDGARLH